MDTDSGIDTTAVPAEDAADGDAEWTRVSDWPAWMDTNRLRRAVLGWRPDARTVGVLLILFIGPMVAGQLWNLRFYVDRLFGSAPDLNTFNHLVPTWTRIAYGAALGLVAAQVVTMSGAVLLLMAGAAKRRAGAWVAAAGLAIELASHIVYLVVYMAVRVEPTGSVAFVDANIATRLLLLGVVALLLRRPPEPEPEEAQALA